MSPSGETCDFLFQAASSNKYLMAIISMMMSTKNLYHNMTIFVFNQIKGPSQKCPTFFIFGGGWSYVQYKLTNALLHIKLTGHPRTIFTRWNKTTLWPKAVLFRFAKFISKYFIIIIPNK